jgi:uncharacterized protein involved in exopolysaccharide biosynthesis
MTAVNVQPPPTRTVLTPGTGGDHDVLTWEGLLALLRRYRWLLLAAVVLGAVIPATMALTQPRTYTAISRFILNRPPGSTGGISGLASQIGLRAPDAGGMDSPEFYADLSKSREILWSVANSPLGADSGRLVLDFLGVQAENPLLTKERAVISLRGSVDARVVGNGVVEVRVSTSDPVVSRQMSEALLSALDRFILEARHKRSSAERQFTERRLRETQAELRVAQDALASFLERNRSYRNAPELTVRFERLSTEVSLRQQLFAAATLAYEQAKVDEIRDTPTMIVIENPDTPVAPDSRGLVRKAGMGVFIAFGLAAFYVLVMDFRARMARRAGPV